MWALLFLPSSYHQKTFFMDQNKDSFGSHLHLMKRCYNYSNCTHKGAQGSIHFYFDLCKYFAFKSTRLCQHSVNPKVVFIKVRIIWWGRGGSGRHLDSLAPPPPTEMENLRHGYWQGIFLISIPDDSYEKQMFRDTLPWNRAKLSSSLEKREGSMRWWKGGLLAHQIKAQPSDFQPW